MSATWCIVLLGAAVALWLVPKSRRYSLLYADAHLVEISRQLADLRAQQEPEAPGDGPALRHFTTSAGLTVAYGHRQEGPEVFHHLSLSHRDVVIAQGAAQTLIAFMVGLLGLDPARVEVATSARFVTHAAFRLSAQEHQALVARPPTVIDVAEAPGWLRRAMAQRSQLRDASRGVGG
jgi:hypothetical protein